MNSEGQAIPYPAELAAQDDQSNTAVDHSVAANTIGREHSYYKSTLTKRALSLRFHSTPVPPA